MFLYLYGLYTRLHKKFEKKACFGGEFTPVLKRWGGFVYFLEVYLVVVCTKYQKIFEKRDFEKNAFKVFLL